MTEQQPTDLSRQDSTPASQVSLDANQTMHSEKPKNTQDKHSFLANLAFNIIIPTVIMTKLSSEDYLGPVYSIVIALAFPVVFGIRDYVKSHKPNFFSILGVISVLLTGSMSLLKLDPQYIAIKEAAIPALFGLATLISMRTRYPLVRTFLFNEQILQIGKVKEALIEFNNERAFDGKLRNASFMIAGSFFLSSVLNYALAKYILVSEPGTVEFTEELGKMTALSFPVIALPSTIILMLALYYLLHHIQKMTHLELDDIFNHM